MGNDKNKVLLSFFSLWLIKQPILFAIFAAIIKAFSNFWDKMNKWMTGKIVLHFWSFIGSWLVFADKSQLVDTVQNFAFCNRTIWQALFHKVDLKQHEALLSLCCHGEETHRMEEKAWAVRSKLKKRVAGFYLN